MIKILPITLSFLYIPVFIAVKIAWMYILLYIIFPIINFLGIFAAFPYRHGSTRFDFIPSIPTNFLEGLILFALIVFGGILAGVLFVNLINKIYKKNIAIISFMIIPFLATILMVYAEILAIFDGDMISWHNTLAQIVQYVVALVIVFRELNSKSESDNSYE
tara:strand:- start:249 stop:734 length:486 start_codon:yes stop_codon:yes gene_type:complete